MTVHLKLLGAATLAGLLLSTVAYGAECAKGPVTVGLLPKLDTDPVHSTTRNREKQLKARAA